MAPSNVGPGVLIPVSLQVETINQRPACDTLQSLRVDCQPRQSIFKLMHGEVFGAMQAGAIQDHYDQGSRMRGPDLGEELVHPPSVHFLADHPIQFAFPRTNRSLDISELSSIAVVDHRPQRRRRPAAFESDHATETCLVLEHQPHATRFYAFSVEEICQRLREFFFQSSCAFGSASGCRVSGATVRQPWRSNIRYTTVAATDRPTFWAKAARNEDTTSILRSWACSTQGAKNFSSSFQVKSARRRLPQFRGATWPQRFVDETAPAIVEHWLDLRQAQPRFPPTWHQSRPAREWLARI